MFLERQRQSEKDLISAIDAQQAIQVMCEFDRFSGIAAMAGQGWQGEAVGAQGDGVIGGDDASIMQTEAAREMPCAVIMVRRARR